jgi:hypothetical protein
MFMQAWGNYGIAWPVVHQWLGVRPDLGSREIDFVPQVPQGQTTIAGRDIRLGNGSADVSASHTGDRYVTRVSLHGAVGAKLVMIGHTLPRGSHPAAVYLDGHRVQHYRMVQTNRGVEISVATQGGQHTLTVQA